MDLQEMYEQIPTIRTNFRQALEATGGDVRKSIQDSFKDCGSLFEEDTVIENLKEEFENYVRGTLVA